jgi:hypothetical protein
VYDSVGISGVGRFVSFSNYGQALVGVRLLSFDAHYTESVTADPNAPLDQPGKTLFDAVLPARQAFFLEAGVMTGNVARLKCSANCASPTYAQSTFTLVNPALFYPMAGLRYVFNTNAASKTQAIVNRSWQLEVHADALFEPLNDSKAHLLWGDLSSVERGHVGVVAGVTFPLCRKLCVWPALMGGYLSAPRSALIGIGLGG